MLSTYNTKDEFLNAVSSRLKGKAEINTALLAGISEADDVVRAESLGDESQGLNLKFGSWVVRDDDIPIFEAVNATAGAVALSLGTAGLAWPAVASALTALANMCWRLWRKGARLSSRQVSVYGCLQAHGPITLQALADRLKTDGCDISREDAASTLETLTEIELNDGQILSLVSKDANDRWKALKI